MSGPRDKHKDLASRRRFLAGLSALALAHVAGSRLRGHDSGIPNYLPHFFGYRSAAPITVGQRYLEKAPAESSISWLSETIFGNHLLSGHPEMRVLIAHVRALRRRDFSDGDLVEIDGWLITRTEARLCALAALSSGA
jgi:hypothetical protein